MNNDKKFWEQKSVKIALLGIAIALFILMLSRTAYEISQTSLLSSRTPAMNTVTINGVGEVVAKPDVATLSFSFSEKANVVKDAQDKVTSKMDKALEAVKALGVEEKDIKTIAYNIYPNYEYQNSVCPVYQSEVYPGYCPPGRSVQVGFEVSHMVEVKVRDTAKAGEVLSAVGTAGAQNVSGLTFTIDDPEAKKNEARGLAIDNAKKKAEVLAEQLGVKLVRIISFYDNTEQPYYGPMYGMGGDAMYESKSSAPSIPSGENKISANVSVTYEIR